MTGVIESPLTSGVVPMRGASPPSRSRRGRAGRSGSISRDSASFGGKGGFAIAGLRALMNGILAIGTRAYAGDEDRLFAYQFGDGFVIVGD